MITLQAIRMMQEAAKPKRYDYVYCWGPRMRVADLSVLDRKGQPCRIIARGAKNSAVVEFADGTRYVISRNALRRTKGEDSPGTGTAEQVARKDGVHHTATQRCAVDLFPPGGYRARRLWGRGNRMSRIAVYWMDRKNKQRCHEFPKDVRGELAGPCLGKAGHPEPHENQFRQWRSGDRTSQPRVALESGVTE